MRTRPGTRAAALPAVLLAAALLVGGCGYAVKTGGFQSVGIGGVHDSEVCDQVRQGIDAFNQGDYQTTVEHFTQAVPLAHQRVVADDTTANEQLLEAVVYYAELPPDQYLTAAQSSPDFARYKQITLGQCEGGAPAPESSSPGLST